jgi:hypothetical protein
MVAPLIAALAAAITLRPGDPPGGSDDVSLKLLADRCGSQIEWSTDGLQQKDGGAAFRYVEKLPKPEPEKRDALIRKLLDDALARAAKEKKLVLWHAYRIEGMQMYRAPNLDDYMDEVAWSDPAVVELVNSSFVPLRTFVPKTIGASYGIVAWDKVEPALIFLTPDGKVAHVVDRIRTFDARWFAEVLRRVLLAHPDLAPKADAGTAKAGAPSVAGSVRTDATQHDYYRALSDYYGGKESEALAGWRALAESSPGSPYAWRAAANLIPAPDKTWPGAARHGFETPAECWLPPGRTIPTDTRWRRTPAEADAVAAAAVQWLLRMQRPDGSWNDLRYAYWDTPLITPNAWMAVTSLAATALSEWHDVAPAEIDKALARAEDYLYHGTGRVNAGKNEECYACAYRILYLHRTLAQTESAESRKELLAKEQELADRLVALQTVASGQWAHEYDNAFATAVMLDALADVEKDGGTVMPEAVKKGIAGLEAARYEDGSFVYGSTHPAQQTKSGPDALKNACGRMPVCEGALFRRGRSDTRWLVFSLTNFQQHYEQFEKIHKCDFHTDGELGGFFFFHDVYHATEAMRLLPEKGQAAFKKWFVEKLTALPEMDGSFLDDHELGKSCATSYALLALRNSIEEGSN